MKRRQSLHKCAEVLLANTETLASLLAEKQGKPIRDSIGEIRRSADLIKDLATLEFPVEILQDNESLLLSSRQECRP